MGEYAGISSPFYDVLKTGSTERTGRAALQGKCIGKVALVSELLHEMHQADKVIPLTP
jgi:hypothetical protein